MEILTSGFRGMDGLAVGHWTDQQAKTGCTVIRFDEPARTAIDVRGAAPGTRELELLQPGKTVQRADAILLSGGSAFGLQAADGVMDWLQQHNRGFPTSAGPVPIVPSAVIFDLATGESIAPTRQSGYDACVEAGPVEQLASGRIGAGTGATIGNINGSAAPNGGGIGFGQVAIAEGFVFGIAVVNAFGAPYGPGDGDPRTAFLERPPTSPPLRQSTTLMACITDIPLDHDALIRLSVSMHDGLARCVAPVHTIADGDVAFASSLESASKNDPSTTLRASIAAELAIESAIKSVIQTT